MHDDLYKSAFWGALARGFTKAAPSTAKAVGGAILGPGKSLASKAGFGAATAYGVGKAMNAGQNGPSLHTPLGQLGSQEASQPPGVVAKAAEAFVAQAARDLWTLHGVKTAFGPVDAVDAASYAAMLGSKFVDPHAHPRLHTALDAGGLLGLAGTTAYGMRHPQERKPGVKDLLGLALFGSSLYDRAKMHGPGHGSGQPT